MVSARPCLPPAGAAGTRELHVVTLVEGGNIWWDCPQGLALGTLGSSPLACQKEAPSEFILI